MKRTTKLVFSALLISISVVLSSIFSYYVPLFGFPTVKLSMAAIPLVLNGIIIGPVYAIVGGLAGDVVAYAMAPNGPFFPGFTLNTILWGLIPALIYKYIFKRKANLDFTLINTILYLVMYGVASYYVLTIEKVEDFIVTDSIRLVMFSVLVILLLGSILVNYYLKNNNNYNGLYSIDKITFIYLIASVTISVGLTPLWLYLMYNVPIVVNTSIRVFKQSIEIPIYVYITYILISAIRHKIKNES